MRDTETNSASSLGPETAVARLEIRIESVEDIRSPLFRESYRLYRRVFPRDEQMPRRYFHEHLAESRLGLSHPFDFHYLVALAGERVVGFGCSTYLAVVNMGFIDYLAVDGSMKGRGVGSRLRGQLVELMREDARRAEHAGLAAVLGEVNPGNPWLTHLMRDGRAFALDLDYRQPPLGKDKKPVPLVLYVEPVSESFDALLASDIRQLLYALYRRLYRIPYPLRDPSFRYMLKQLAGRERVGKRDSI